MKPASSGWNESHGVALQHLRLVVSVRKDNKKLCLMMLLNFIIRNKDLRILFLIHSNWQHMSGNVSSVCQNSHPAFLSSHQIHKFGTTKHASGCRIITPNIPKYYCSHKLIYIVLIIQIWRPAHICWLTIHNKMFTKSGPKWWGKHFLLHGRNLQQTHAPGSRWVVICLEELGYNKGRERTCVAYVAFFSDFLRPHFIFVGAIC